MALSARARPRRGHQSVEDAGAAEHDFAPAPPPTWRDPWAWAAVGSLLLCLLFARGATWGEPINDDFYFIHHALLAKPASWWDGGGVQIYWRPLARQAYFGLLAPLALTHPGALAALHAALLALAALLLYRAFRLHFAGGTAAAIATFPVLTEATRMLVTWPSHFQDLGALLFAALALHEMAHGRRGTALTAVLASLLCKEVAAAVALLLPWMPAPGRGQPPTRRRRVLDTAAIASMLIVWATVYAALLKSGSVGLAKTMSPGHEVPWPVRAFWAWTQSLKSAFSLGLEEGRAGTVLAWLVAIIVVGCIAKLARDARANARRLRWAAWGWAWFLAASLNQAQVYPDWSTNRAVFGTLGVGAALVPLAGGIHPALTGVLVGARVALLARSPGAIQRVASQEPATGRAFDFAHLTRLQRLVRDTRGALSAAFPRLPRGSRVGWLNMPHMATYSFAGDLALQAWYRDTTLSWMPASEYQAHPERAPVVFLAYQSRLKAQVVIVPTAAVSRYFEGAKWLEAGETTTGLAALGEADSLLRDRPEGVLHGAIASVRAVAFYRMGRFDDARREAAASLSLWPENVQAHVITGSVALARGDLAGAAGEVERGRAIDARDPELLELSRRIEAARANPLSR